jgi:hypothetical protein
MKNLYRKSVALGASRRSTVDTSSPTDRRVLAEYEKRLREAVNTPVPPTPETRPDQEKPSEERDAALA